MDIAESTVITMFMIILVFTYILHPVNVVGTSMVPTLKDEDRVFMTTIIPDISYGDIVVINNDKAYLLDENNEIIEKNSYELNECIIKRVIAEGGQTIDIDFVTGDVIVDGKILEEDYINALTLTDEGGFDFPVTVPEGYYFVMGDNRNASSDSRHPYVGFIKKNQIYGKAIIRYAPVDTFKIL
ncbi:MAG: signal peptidase I [Oscillospiraceae bacterium]|nr:signal peptidase I [Oscillospiraceae bacterium]